MDFLIRCIKDYFIVLLIFQIVAYLAPKEGYSKYFQLFAGIMLAVLILKPLLGWRDWVDEEQIKSEISSVMEEVYGIDYEQEGENLIEQFLMEQSSR